MISRGDPPLGETVYIVGFLPGDKAEKTIGCPSGDQLGNKTSA